MARIWSFALVLLFFAGCGGKTVRMAQPEDPQGRYHDQIAAAQRALEQNADWADRVEWEVVPQAAGWRVVAWRVEHPDRKGPERYAPWGYSEIELDSRSVVMHYRPKG